MKNTIKEIKNRQLKGEKIDLKAMLQRAELTWEEIAKYGLDLTHAGECNHPDFEIQKIRIHKTNETKLILMGKTPKGHNLVRIGRVQRLLTQGCPYRTAEIAVFIKYGMEKKVWSLAEKIISTTLLLEKSEIINIKTLNKEILPSAPKIESAIEIAKQVFNKIRHKKIKKKFNNF